MATSATNLDAPANVGVDGKRLHAIKPKTRRGKGKGKSGCLKFAILGNNTNGIMGKKDSLMSAIKSYEYPSVLTFQECKTGKQSFRISGFFLESLECFVF